MSDLKLPKPVLGAPAMKQRTREEHDLIVKLMEDRSLTWQQAVEANESEKK